MNIVNRKLSREEFSKYVSSFSFAPLNPDKLVIHHTWSPRTKDWKGQKSIDGLKRYYEGKGWSSAPHLFIGEDGIWLFSPMNLPGTHAGKGNIKSIGIEVVGDYDNAVWEGETYKNAVHAISELMKRLNIGFDGIKRHNDYSTKSCPGYMITREWIKRQIEVPEWAREAVEWADKKGIMKAERPSEPATRAEIAAIAKRIVELIVSSV